MFSIHSRIALSEGNFPSSSGSGTDCSGLAGLAAGLGAGDRSALGIAIVETAVPRLPGLSQEQRGETARRLGSEPRA